MSGLNDDATKRTRPRQPKHRMLDTLSLSALVRHRQRVPKQRERPPAASIAPVNPSVTLVAKLARRLVG
jgi:hypothetical protein